ncbi:MAG: DNA polymerase I [Ardenticatenales bacterium]|nr:DNA polymerase I [Ardenticatenales bacterium]
MSTLLLLDGHSLAYRAFFALPPEMSTKSGEPTNATYGFATMLLDVLERERPDYIAVAFDVGRTWRHDRYADYKGHRAKAPSELRQQISRIRELVAAFGIPEYTAPGWEADDVLGTLARQAVEQDTDVIILSGDTDAHQLVTDRIHVQTPGRSFSELNLYDPAAIDARYGLTPSQLIDLKAILGDKSDNIPGVFGVGQKTATSLLQQYESLEGIYDHLDEVATRWRSKLAEQRDNAFLSKALVRIDCAVPNLSLDLAAARTQEYDPQRLFEMFSELEFSSLIGRLPDSSSPPVEQPTIEATYRLVGDRAALQALADRVAKASAVTLDVETDSTDAIQANLVGLAVGLGPGTGYYIPIAHGAQLHEGQLSFDDPDLDESHNLPLDEVVAALDPLLKRPELRLYAHNAKFDVEVMVNHGFSLPEIDHDTMIGAWLLNPGSRAVGLKALALSELGVGMTEITELIGKGRSQITMDQVPVEQVVPYAGADVDMTSRLVPLQEEALASKSLDRLFREIEMPLVSVLIEMERTGVSIDHEVLGELRQRLTTNLHGLEQQIYGLVGHEFNINSPVQLSEVLFEELGLDKSKSSKTRTGSYSTAYAVLEKLKDDHEVVELVLEARSIQKLLSTYIEALPRMINPRTGRIHTDFSMIVAETGRLSSSNPNLQNIPIRTPIGREIRRAFVAPPGHYLMAADYSQVELRVLAHLSGDEAMTDSFLRGEDIHAATAARLFHEPIEAVSYDQRRIAKIINFGLLYGMGAFRLGQEAGLNFAEADEALHTYFKSFPKIASYLDGIVSDAAKQGYAETIMGRRRYFPELMRDATSNQGRAAERAAKNHPIQGSAAEIIKLAMITIHRFLQESELKTRMVLQVHDELLFEIPEEELPDVAPLLVGMMADAMELSVPLKVDASIGYNWAEMVPMAEL